MRTSSPSTMRCLRIVFFRTSVRLICGWHRLEHGLIENLQKEKKRHRDVDFELKLIDDGQFFGNL